MRWFDLASEAVAVRHGPCRLVLAALVVGVTAIALFVAWPDLRRVGESARLVAATDPTPELDREINAEFGMQNPVVWVVAAKTGTVWTPSRLRHLHAVTREVLTIPGVLATEVLSLSSPNVRDVQVTEDALDTVYLMGTVPETSEGIDTLRQRVEGNPNYHGVFVSLDGRAAMVVADFRPDADAGAIAAAALAIRDRHRDAETDVYVSGRPLMGAAVRPAVPAMTVAAGLMLTAAAGVFFAVAGGRAVAAALVAMVLALVWTLAGVAAAGVAVLPWTLFAALPTALLAAAFGTVGDGRWRAQGGIAVALAAGLLVMGITSGDPARAFGIAGACGVVGALAAAQIARRLAGMVGRPWRDHRWRRLAAVAGTVLAMFGLVWLDASFGMFGYGLRYLPGEAAADLRGLAEHFPPPTALAIRVRGKPGFMATPAVMKAFNSITSVAREDRDVVRAMSLADLVKIVHRTFNGNRPEFFVIPEDATVISRYLMLSYSPGFRRFVDRALSRAAIWVYVSSDHPSDLDRVRARLTAQIAARPISGAEVDRIGGDGAVILAMAATARRFMVAAMGGLLAAAAVLALVGGLRAGLGMLAGGAVAGGAAAGALGWSGLPIDVVSLACVVSAGVGGGALGALSTDGSFRDVAGLLLALGTLAVALLAVPYGGANALGAGLLGLVLAPGVCAAGWRACEGGSSDAAPSRPL